MHVVIKPNPKGLIRSRPSSPPKNSQKKIYIEAKKKKKYVDGNRTDLFSAELAALTLGLGNQPRFG